MIGTLLNLLFRCPHRRLTHPVAPITNVGRQHSQAYVVCLDCGKPFEYDMEGMKIGKLIDDFHGVYAVPKKHGLAAGNEGEIRCPGGCSRSVGDRRGAESQEGAPPQGGRSSMGDRPGGLSR